MEIDPMNIQAMIDPALAEVAHIDVKKLDESVAMFTAWGVRLISAAVIVIAGWMAGNWIQDLFQNIKKLDETLKSFLGGSAKYLVFAIAIITVLGQFGVQTASLLAVLGAAGLAIGLALQGTLSNVAAGVMILILRPFNVGDYIEFGTDGGTVKSLGLFATEMARVDNVYVFAPNSTIWNSNIYNFSRNKQRRQDIVVGISYHDDINKAFKVIEKVLESEKRLINTADKKSEVMVGAMGDFSVNIIIRVWSSTQDFLTVKWDLTKAIKEAFDKEGITIPFPTRTIEHVTIDEKPQKKKRRA